MCPLCFSFVYRRFQLSGKRHTARRGDTLPERAGAHIDAGCTLHIGMALEHSAHVPELLKFIERKIALEREHRVKAWAAMAF